MERQLGEEERERVAAELLRPSEVVNVKREDECDAAGLLYHYSAADELSDFAVAAVVDTSFLMLQKVPAAWGVFLRLARIAPKPQGGLDEEKRPQGLARLAAMLSGANRTPEPAPNLQLRQRPPLVRLIIPDLVRDEVAKHFGTEKDLPARLARKRIAEAVEAGGVIEPISGVKPADRHDALSADSDTDRKILSYSKQLAASQPLCCVFVATDDGGIMYDVARLRQAGEPLAALTKESRMWDVCKFILQHFARSSDSWARCVLGKLNERDQLKRLREKQRLWNACAEFRRT